MYKGINSWVNVLNNNANPLTFNIVALINSAVITSMIHDNNYSFTPEKATIQCCN